MISPRLQRRGTSIFNPWWIQITSSRDDPQRKMGPQDKAPNAARRSGHGIVPILDSGVADGSLYYVMPQLPVEAASLAVTD